MTTVNHALIQACLEQNRAAQQQLYTQLLPYLRAVADRYLRDNLFLKDALQESFVKIFRHLRTYDPAKAPFKQWCARITVNTCLNFNQRVMDKPRLELSKMPSEPSIPPGILQQFSDEHLLAVLKQMPDGYFEVFNLFVIDEYSHEEIASLLGINEALSRKRLSRAKAWLKTSLSQHPEWLTGLKSLNLVVEL